MFFYIFFSYKIFCCTWIDYCFSFFLLILIAILKHILIVIISKIILFNSCWLLLLIDFKFFPIFCTDIYFSYIRDYLGRIQTIFLSNNTPNNKIIYISSNIFVYNYPIYYILLLIFFIIIILTQIRLILKIFDNSIYQ